MVELRVSIDIDAPAERVFTAMTDWAHQSEWMPGTSVAVSKGRGDAVGDEILARTALSAATSGFKAALGRAGFDDPMRITGWQAPVRCEVLHLGRVVKGAGVFEVEQLDEGRSRYTWIEWVDPPLGVIGQLGLRVARRPAEFALRVAAKRFARWVEQRPS